MVRTSIQLTNQPNYRNKNSENNWYAKRYLLFYFFIKNSAILRYLCVIFLKNYFISIKRFMPTIFKDINFKLAVIQVLMYEMEVLEPKFDLTDFVKNHKTRQIDLATEGLYETIPEALAYFEALHIPNELLALVEEIYQDGGNEIHFELVRQWDGEDDLFNITSTDDLHFVPNLKKITLLYDDDERMVDAFMEVGVSAEYL
jgi:hypothetical protein